MSTIVSDVVSSTATTGPVSSQSRRAEALAVRLEQGAQALADLATGLDDAAWQARIPKDGRTIGVIVHHVGTMYPIEIELALKLAAGEPVEGVTWQKVHVMNANHAGEYDDVTKVRGRYTGQPGRA